MQALMAFTTSGMTSFIWQNTWLPCGSSWATSRLFNNPFLCSPYMEFTDNILCYW